MITRARRTPICEDTHEPTLCAPQGRRPGEWARLPAADHASRARRPTGMSTVHVNRTLQELRGNGLITTPKGGRVVILDWPGLQEAGQFDATYLHIKKAA